MRRGNQSWKRIRRKWCERRGNMERTQKEQNNRGRHQRKEKRKRDMERKWERVRERRG